MLEMTLIIHGQVQGVGFRYSIVDAVESEQLMVKGSIQNLPNGTVEIKAQGTIEQLKDLRRIVVSEKYAPSIRDIEESIMPINNYTMEAFGIKY
ncbi:MAG: acylphosphatase [Bacteriovoracaceae bacterium]|jgi:acylphosphatase|nr:acylphosphatase [Bacteriovoracaceae bacterium]